MEQSDTKSRILYKALDLFSQKGYNGVSMRDIASEVGIQGSSIYNHFKSKQNIMDCIVEEMGARYEKALISMQLPSGEDEEVLKEYQNATQEKIWNITEKILRYFLYDECAVKFRRILSMGRYDSEEMNRLFRKFYFDHPLGFQEKVFREMTDSSGSFQGNPRMLALQFYAPVYFMMDFYDETEENREEIFSFLEEHIRQFFLLFQKN